MIFIMGIIGISLLFLNNEGIHANPQSPPPSFEEKFTEVGYKSVEESVKEFEDHLQYDVKLPQIVPSIDFTHKFGRFYEDKEYNTNDSLEIRFVNKDFSQNTYKIDIRSLENKLNYEGKEYVLQDGSKAIYFESHQFNFLVFEKNNLQYVLGIHKKISNTETLDMLIRIANSVKKNT